MPAEVGGAAACLHGGGLRGGGAPGEGRTIVRRKVRSETDIAQ